MSPARRGDARVADARRQVAKALHDGILQDLTVAGFRLRALQRSEGADLRAEIGDFAEWLRERQAALRDMVSDLATSHQSPLEDVLTQMRGVLPETCQLTWRTEAESSTSDTVRLGAAIGAVAHALAQASSPRLVEIELQARDRLRVAHDGRPLRGNAALAAELRQSIRGLGGTLRLVRHGETEVVYIGWGAER